MPKTLDDLLLEHGDNELEHYGVLGMKWGVRKNRETGRREGKPVAGTKAAKRSTPSVSPASSMSTQQLRETNERLRLEQEYERLTALPVSAQKKWTKGKMERLINRVGNKVIDSAVDAAFDRVVDSAVKRLKKK